MGDHQEEAEVAARDRRLGEQLELDWEVEREIEQRRGHVSKQVAGRVLNLSRGRETSTSSVEERPVPTDERRQGTTRKRDGSRCEKTVFGNLLTNGYSWAVSSSRAD